MNEAEFLQKVYYSFKDTALLQGIREISADAMGQATQSEAAIAEVAKKDDFVYGEHMALILIHSSEIKITFKVHFVRHTFDAIVLKLTGSSLHSVVFDFMKEYCNLVAGWLADVLSANSLTANVSIPLVTAGFDEVCFSDRFKEYDARDWWEVNIPQAKVVCSTVIEWSRGFDLAKLRIPGRGDKVEFL